MRRPLLAGLDVGTHQITAAVGQLNAAQGVEVIALRTGPSRGLAHGTIVDLADCVDAMARIIRQVEAEAGARLLTAAATIHGPTIRSQTANASLALADATSEIHRRDVERVLTACRAAVASYDRQHLHEFVQRFSVDGQDGVRDPVGLFGGRLEADLHVVTIPASTLQSWRKALNQAGVEVTHLVLPGVATSYAVLTELDRDLGAIVVDIGGAHTDIICWADGAIRETLSVPWGGDRLTQRLADRLELPLAAAESVKLSCNTIEPGTNGDEAVRAPIGPGGSRTVSRREVAELLAREVKVLLTAVRKRLDASRYFREASAGLVVTGGTVLMEGVIELAETICNLPVRFGAPHGITCQPKVTLPPIASTAVGLLTYQLAVRRSPRVPELDSSAHPIGRLVQRARVLLEDYF